MRDRSDVLVDDNPHGLAGRLLRPESLRLSDAGLLALIFSDGEASATMIRITHQLLAENGGILGLLDLPQGVFDRHRGIYPDGRRALDATVEIYRRLHTSEPSTAHQLEDPESAAVYLAERYRDDRQEIAGVLLLDAQCLLLGDGVERDPKQPVPEQILSIQRRALLLGARRLIPFRLTRDETGRSMTDDSEFALALKQACSSLLLEVVDHVVLAVDGNWRSVHQHGRLGEEELRKEDEP